MSLFRKPLALFTSLALVLGLAVSSSAATAECERSSGNFKSTLEAGNVASASCPSGAVTKIQIEVENGLTGQIYNTGTIVRCGLSTDPIWFIQAGGFHIFQTANNGVWGLVGGGLCSFYSYIAA